MSDKKQVLVMFGGVSAEHEVSVISGLQIIDTIDRTQYESHAVFISKTGEMFYIPGLTSGKQFLKAKRVPVSFGADSTGGYITTGGMLSKKVYPYAAYLAFHGGPGEAGGVQGMLETVGIPQTSTSQESAAIVMNKQLTKTVLAEAGITTVPGISVFSDDITNNTEAVAARLIKELSLPVIIKPVHLGSSIGISIARTDVELQKHLLEAAHVDSEILIEKLLTDFTELNCALRRVNGTLEISPVEQPIQHDEILSFDDKYTRGGKNKAAGSMAFMDRDVPAQIPDALRDRIQETAKKSFHACRMQGSPRIDFMYTKSDDTLYLTEINPIPGSFAFFLWEAQGIPFQQQISDSIEQAVLDASIAQTQRLDYETDIVEKFIKAMYQ